VRNVFCAVAPLGCCFQRAIIDEPKIGKLLGGISFPLYLNVDEFAVNFFLKRSLNWIPVTEARMLFYIGSVMAGAATYLLIDRNVMAKRNNYYSPQLGMALGVIAYVFFLFGLCFGLSRWW
jgi:hypothetical protein